MKFDSASADAIYVRGLCLYFKDNLDKGLTHFSQVLALDPDHNKARIMRLKAKSLKEKKENGQLTTFTKKKHNFLFLMIIMNLIFFYFANYRKPVIQSTKIPRGTQSLFRST